MKKIIYLCYLPLTDKREKDFYIPDLLKSGFLIEYWDITDIYFRHMTFSGSISRDYQKKIVNLQEFEDCLGKEDQKNVVFVPIITYAWKVLRLFRLLSKYGFTTYFFDRGRLPYSSKRRSTLTRLAGRVRYLSNPGNLYASVTHALAVNAKKINYIKEYDGVFSAGPVTKNDYGQSTRIIPINYFDYDEYLSARDDHRRLLKDEYCVFIDDNLAYDTDFKMFNKQSVDPSRYYKTLNVFFELVEAKYRLKVVIAAHPKSDYSGSVFNNREIRRFETNELVRDCSFAIAHYSTAVAFAVLYKKPCIFVYTDEMKKLPYFKVIEAYASILNCSLCNISSLSNGSEIVLKNTDYQKYEAYKYTYLTSKGTESILTRDIVIQAFGSL